MKNRNNFLFSIIVIGLLFCISTSCKNRVGKNKNMDTHKIKVGETVDISLKANPTTGFQWLEAEPIDSTIIKIENKEYKADPNPDKMAGVGGKETWTFKGVGKGKTVVNLVYSQPWNKDDTTATTKKIEFRVR